MVPARVRASCTKNCRRLLRTAVDVNLKASALKTTLPFVREAITGVPTATFVLSSRLRLLVLYTEYTSTESILCYEMEV